MKQYCLLGSILLLLLCNLSCSRSKSVDTAPQFSQQELQIIAAKQALLRSGKVPKLFSSIEDFKAFIKASPDTQWVKLSESPLSDHFINASGAEENAVFRSRIFHFEINSGKDNALHGITFSEARKIAVSLLPREQPLNRNKITEDTNLPLTYEKYAETASAYNRSEGPVIRYETVYVTTNNLSKSLPPDPARAYATNISIIISYSGVTQISLIDTYSPDLYENSSFPVEINDLHNPAAIKGILDRVAKEE